MIEHLISTTTLKNASYIAVFVATASYLGLSAEQRGVLIRRPGELHHFWLYLQPCYSPEKVADDVI